MSVTPNRDNRMVGIIGAGTYGSVIRELAESCGFDVVAFLDDGPSKWDTTLDGVRVAGPIASGLDQLPTNCGVVVAIGNNKIRLRWLQEARRSGRHIPKLVSPHATVSPSATLDDGVYLHAGSHVWTYAKLGLGTILSPNATVAHHTELGNACFVSTGANVGASIRVGVGAMFGMGSTTSTGVTFVAEYTLVGAGAVIIRDTEPFGVYVGSPGRLLDVRKS